MSEITCFKCGKPKFSGLFTESEKKAKSPVCMKCISERNKARRIRNIVPAAHGFNSFDHRNQHTCAVNYADKLKGVI